MAERTVIWKTAQLHYTTEHGPVSTFLRVPILEGFVEASAFDLSPEGDPLPEGRLALLGPDLQTEYIEAPHDGQRLRLVHDESEGQVVIHLPQDAMLVAEVMIRMGRLGFDFPPVGSSFAAVMEAMVEDEGRSRNG